MSPDPLVGPCSLDGCTVRLRGLLSGPSVQSPSVTLSNFSQSDEVCRMVSAADMMGPITWAEIERERELSVWWCGWCSLSTARGPLARCS